MGGPGSGRKMDEARRRQVAALRARGLSWAEIGRRLGISEGTARYEAGRDRRPKRPRPRLPCAACRRPIPGSEAAGVTTGAVLCPDCLAKRPGATFGQRLQSLRVSRGLTRTALSRAAGVRIDLYDYETGRRRRPRPPTLARLARALGVRPEDLAGG